MNISRVFQYKFVRNQIDPAVKRSRSIQIHLLCKPGRAQIPNATYQVPRPLAFWYQRRRYLKEFYLIWAWWPSWPCDGYVTINICYKFTPLDLRSRHIKFEFNNWPSGFWENYVLKIESEYDQEMPQSQSANNPNAPRGRATQSSQHQGDKISKATSSLFPIKMIAILEWT